MSDCKEKIIVLNSVHQMKYNLAGKDIHWILVQDDKLISGGQLNFDTKKAAKMYFKRVII